MARRSKNREINVFSASAIDLFASSMGVFIILVVVLFPYFGNKSKEEVKQPIVDHSQEIKKLQQELKQKEVELKTERTELVKKQEIIKNLEKQTLLTKKSEQTIKELEKKIEKLSKSQTKAPPQDVAKEKDQQIAELKKKIKQQQEKSREVASNQENSEKLKTQIEKLKQQNKVLKNEVKTTKEDMLKASNQSINNQELLETIQKSKEELIQYKAKVDHIKSKQQEVQDELVKSRQMASTEKDRNKKLEEQIKKLKGQGGAKSFLAVILKWSTAKHDVDLVIKDPKGRQYNYKKKKHSGSAGEFVLDSRSGPGAEVWQSQQLEPGTYTLSATLYNTYGNEKDAKVAASIFTKKGKKDIPLFKLSSDKNTKKIKFNVQSDGEIKL